MKPTPKVAYVVFRGRKPGVYTSWPECQLQVDGFSGCKHAAFYTTEAATEAWNTWDEKIKAKLLSTEAATASKTPNVNVRYQGESIHEPAYWIEPSAPVYQPQSKTTQFRSSSPTSFPARGKPTYSMPGQWPERSDSPNNISSETKPVYQSRHFPPCPDNGSTAAQPRTFSAPARQPLYHFDPPLWPQSPKQQLKREIQIIDLTDDLRYPDLEGPAGKRVKREPKTGLDFPDSNIHMRPQPVPEQNTVEETKFLADFERKERARHAMQAPVEELVELSIEQNEVLKMALRKNNIFLTGAAGSGKTVTLKEILRQLKDKGKVVEVIAPTGIAALPLGGRTTFSFAGWTPDDLRKSITQLMQKRKKRVVECIKKLDVLIIEEISMGLSRVPLVPQGHC